MKTIKSRIENLCRPFPHVCKDEEEASNLFTRNYVTFLVFGTFLFVSPLVHLALGITLEKLAVFGVISAVQLNLLLFCRSHPTVFHLLFMIIMTGAGPFLLYFNRDIFHCALTSVIAYPIFVYCVTGKGSLWLCSMFAQFSLLRYLYYPRLLETFMNEEPSKVTNSFINGVIYSSVFSLMLSFFMDHFLRKANKEIAALKKLQYAAQKQNEFLLILSHEIRNPLNGIIGSIQSALFENPPLAAVEFLNTAEMCGELLLHLLNNILDSGKVELGNLEVHPVSTSMKEIMERVWAICSTILKKKDLKGYMKVCKNLPKALIIDPYRLTQILVNLVGNAAKFTNQGTITISIRWLPNMTAVNNKCFEPIPYDHENEGIFERDESHFHREDFQTLQINQKKFKEKQWEDQNNSNSQGILKIVVRDTGKGIRQEDLPKLFDKFSQIGEDSDQRKIGTGLGLYITKEITKRMDGEIRAYSKVGIGSSMIVCIPCQQPFQAELPLNVISGQNVVPEAILSSVRAMVVDDDVPNLKIFSQYLLRKKLHVVATAKNGAEAVQQYERHRASGNPINLILMDINMPMMDGKEASQKIRAFERENCLKPAVIIISSGNCMESEIKKCLDPEGLIRAQSFLKKPVQYDALSLTIDELTHQLA